jgi:hypothetical protein
MATSWTRSGAANESTATFSRNWKVKGENKRRDSEQREGKKRDRKRQREKKE